MAKNNKVPATIPNPGQSATEKSLEAEALQLLRRNARADAPGINGVGEVRALIDAAVRRYGCERKIREVQSEFNALVVTLKEKEGSQQLIKMVARMLAIMKQIDTEFSGDPERGIPSARQYMEQIIVPQSEKQLFDEMMMDLAKASGIVDEDEDEDESAKPNVSKFEPPAVVLG